MVEGARKLIDELSWLTGVPKTAATASAVRDRLPRTDIEPVPELWPGADPHGAKLALAAGSETIGRPPISPTDLM